MMRALTSSNRLRKNLGKIVVRCSKFFRNACRCKPLPDCSKFVIIRLSSHPIQCRVRPAFVNKLGTGRYRSVTVTTYHVTYASTSTVHNGLDITRLGETVAGPYLSQLRAVRCLLNVRVIARPRLGTGFYCLPAIPALVSNVVANGSALRVTMFVAVNRRGLQIGLGLGCVNSQ